MSQKEFDELMGDDEEVPGTPGQENRGMDELEEMFNESEFDANDSQIAGTQGASIARLGDKVCFIRKGVTYLNIFGQQTFKPLFEDD